MSFLDTDTERLNYPWLQEFFFSTPYAPFFVQTRSVTRFVRALPFQGLIKNEAELLDSSYFVQICFLVLKENTYWYDLLSKYHSY